MSDLSGGVVQWKQIWQHTSGIYYATPKQLVRQKLMEVSKELCDGLLQYKKNTPKSSSDLEKMLKTNKYDKLLSFTNRLCQYLDIDALQSWHIYEYYLAKEYKGSGQSLSSYISVDDISNMIKLLDDIWRYYSLERMIVLKVIKNIIEFHDELKHPYHEEYNLVVQQIDFSKLRKSLLNQLEQLITESPPSKLVLNEYGNPESKLVQWSERCGREINEILQILMLIVKFNGINDDELIKLLEIFKLHSFGRNLKYLSQNNENHIDLSDKICYSEVGLFVVAMNCEKIDKLKSNSKFIEIMDRIILTFNQNEEHSPLLLTWMLFNLNIDKINDALTRKYQQFGKQAIHLNVFLFLNKMISHNMFSDAKNRSGVILRRSIYNHLDYMFSLFGIDCITGNNNHIYELFSEILKTADIGSDFIENEEKPIWLLFNFTMQNFPVQFIPFSLIAKTLAISGDKQKQFIKNQLDNLPGYTEIYNMNKFNLNQPNSTNDKDLFFLTHDYCPFKLIEYKIPKGTNCYVLDERNNQTLVHFVHKFNYFNSFYYEITELFDETQKFTEINQNRLKRVEIGSECLANLLKNIQSGIDITPEMYYPIEIVFDVFIRFKHLKSPPITLFANCLNIIANLIPLYEDELLTRILTLNILPILNNNTLDYKKCAMGISFDSGLIGNYLIDYERNNGKYDFLLSYFNFLNSLIDNNNNLNSNNMNNQNIFHIKLSGLVFLLREIFPNIHTWRFDNEKDREQIYIQTMEYFLNILENITDSNSLIRKTCIYSLLNFENGTILLKFIRMGNSYLTLKTENETNWITTPYSGLNLIVQYCMKILMFILKFKNCLTVSTNETFQYPLEMIIYNQTKHSDALHIIPNITSYMSNIFNRCLPVLSCRLLRRFAIEFQIALLAYLNMEPDQLRLTFLQRLSDDLENDELKIAVLEFVEACIEKQPGVTDAFFDISTDIENRKLLFEKTRKRKNISEGILKYMDKYLDDVSTNPNNIELPIFNHIMSLYHALWKQNLTILIEPLIQKPKFWISLCKPLFSETVNPNLKIYSQLFNILGIEVYKSNFSSKMNDELKTILHDFFEKNCFENWVNLIFNLPNNSNPKLENRIIDEIPVWLGRLQSFKDLIIIILRTKNNSIKIPDKSIKMLIEQSLEQLVENAKSEKDFRPFIILSEFLLIVLTDLKFIFTDNKQELTNYINQISYLINFLSISYQEIHVRSRNSILSISIKSFDIIKFDDTMISDEILEIIKSVIEIISYELLQIERTDKILSDNENYSLVLSINLLQKIVLIFDSIDYPDWDGLLIQNKMFHKILSCLTKTAQIYEYRKVTNELLDLLVILSRTKCSNELLYTEIGSYLWLKLLPPKEILIKNETTKWKSQDWWPIYSRGIQLITILLNKHTHMFIQETLMFVGIHEEYLVDSLLLSKQTLESNAITLIKRVIEFIAETLSFEKTWRIEHGQSMFNLMKCIQLIMEHSVFLFYRPNILKQLLENTKNTTEHVVTVMNELIEFIILSTKCLLTFSPKLLELLANPEFVPSQWFPLIEIQFGAPKLNIEEFPPLTFGTLLNAVSIFVKSLNLQSFTFNGKPLNYLPNETNQTSPDTSQINDSVNLTSAQTSVTQSPNVSSKTSPRTPYIKSISVTGTTSIIPSNELLLNLDCNKSIIALESIMTLLASQSLLALKDINLSNREKQLIRRELYNELSIYHDFVRKKISKDFKEILHRKKRGCAIMQSNDDNDMMETPKQTPSTGSLSSSYDNRKSVRVNLLRNLHLQQTHSNANIADTPKRRSILSDPKRKFLMTSTPSQSGSSQSQSSSSSSLKRVMFDDDVSKSKTDNNIVREEHEERNMEHDIEYDEPTEQEDYSSQSYVKLVEEDYFHFLSIVFSTLHYFED